jgi:omega-6 fatty acid desaturase (delta-12 desaturase)
LVFNKPVTRDSRSPARRPGYLILNSSGPAKYAKAAHKSHFHPFAALFRDSQRLWIAVSDVGFFAMIAALVWASRVWGFGNVFFYYGVPYLVVNAHLVLITFLQHTDTYVPHYREGEFTWLRGALCTVDRSYGWLLDAAFHHITDTHVAHHLFSHMPWYHAEEATAAMKGILGPFYLKDDTPIPAAAYRAWSQCRFVEDTGDVLFFQSPAAARKAQ